MATSKESRRLVLSPEDEKRLTAEIDAAIRGAAPGTLGEFDFCGAWKIAQPLLEILAKVPTIGLVASIVDAAGGIYAKSKCPQN